MQDMWNQWQNWLHKNLKFHITELYKTQHQTEQIEKISLKCTKKQTNKLVRISAQHKNKNWISRWAKIFSNPQKQWEALNQQKCRQEMHRKENTKGWHSSSPQTWKSSIFQNIYWKAWLFNVLGVSERAKQRQTPALECIPSWWWWWEAICLVCQYRRNCTLDWLSPSFPIDTLLKLPRIWILVFPRFVCENLILNVTVIIGKWLSHEGPTLTNRISVHIKENSFYLLFHGLSSWQLRLTLLSSLSVTLVSKSFRKDITLIYFI